MKIAQAKKLHNGDEVILKRTGEVLTVLRTYQERTGEVTVEAITETNGYMTLSRRDIS